jgi:hypothetical protein
VASNWTRGQPLTDSCGGEWGLCVAYPLLAITVIDPGRLAVWARHADCAVRAPTEELSAHTSLDGLLQRPPGVVHSAQTRYTGPSCCPAAPKHLQAMHWKGVTCHSAPQLANWLYWRTAPFLAAHSQPHLPAPRLHDAWLWNILVTFRCI